MKILRAVLGVAGWLLNAAVTLLVVLLLLRGLVEYAPVLGNFPPIRALLRWWDPQLMRAAQGLGLRWSHDVRGMGLPALAVALIVARIMVEDAVRRLRLPAPKPAAAPPPAPSSPDERTSLAAGQAAPVQSVTGTAFLASGGAGHNAPPRIGRYEIIEELGRGAMGTVYKAQDPRIGRTVAIKTISAVGNGPEMEQYRARFLVEAKSAGRLSHPGIVTVHDVTEDEAGHPCLVLEFVKGETIDRMVADQPLGLDQALDIVGQVARALAFAHAQGVVHRDVKPANIMVTASGQAKLSDFGIAKIEGTTMTIAGQILGTPAFMSPEQCSGNPVDHRSDIFSLGTVLYTLVTGSKPFPGDTFTAVAYKLAHTEQVPVRQINPMLPAALEGIIARCLAKDPAARYVSATLLADDLAAVRAGRSPAQRATGAEAEKRV